LVFQSWAGAGAARADSANARMSTRDMGRRIAAKSR
jgi:hypothetical protein